MKKQAVRKVATPCPAMKVERAVAPGAKHSCLQQSHRQAEAASGFTLLLSPSKRSDWHLVSAQKHMSHALIIVLFLKKRHNERIIRTGSGLRDRISGRDRRKYICKQASTG